MNVLGLTASRDDSFLDDHERLLIDALDETTAREWIARYLRPTDEIFNHPGKRYKSGRSTQERKLLPIIRSQLRTYRENLWQELLKLSSRFDPSILIGAISAAGHAPISGPHRLSCPGRFDPEIEVISNAIAWESNGPAPSWEDVALCIQTARQWLVAFSSDAIFSDPKGETPQEAIQKKVRTEWCTMRGATYPYLVDKLASELLINLSDKALRTIRSYAPEFELLVTQREVIIQSHLAKLSRLPDGYHYDHAVDLLVGSHSPTSAAELLTAETEYSDDLNEVVRNLTWTHEAARGEKRHDSPLLAHPFLTVKEMPSLVSPRRLITDFFDLLDRYLLAACQKDNKDRVSAYSECRAGMLDSTVSSALTKLLPGSNIGTGLIQSTPKKYERDVICYFSDIVLAVETKGSPLKPSALRGSPSLFEHLRENLTKGAKQAIDSAAAAQSLVPTHNKTTGTRFPLPSERPRRSYPVVVSGHTPACLDGAYDDLRRSGILPESNDVLSSSVDRFLIYSLIFDKPDHFVAYLDFRISLIRRPWIYAYDEFDIMGFFLNQSTSEWIRPRHQERIALKPVFDEDFATFLGRASSDAKPVPSWLHLKQSPLVREFTNYLREETPPKWLQAASAALRTPLDCQRWLTRELHASGATLGRSRRRNLTNPSQTANLVIVANPSELVKRDTIRWLENIAVGSALTWFAIPRIGGAGQIVGLRGVDDENYWWHPIVIEQGG